MVTEEWALRLEKGRRWGFVNEKKGMRRTRGIEESRSTSCKEGKGSGVTKKKVGANREGKSREFFYPEKGEGSHAYI